MAPRAAYLRDLGLLSPGLGRQRVWWLYAALFDEDLDAVAAGLDALVPPVCPIEPDDQGDDGAPGTRLGA